MPLKALQSITNVMLWFKKTYNTLDTKHKILSKSNKQISVLKS